MSIKNNVVESGVTLISNTKSAPENSFFSFTDQKQEQIGRKGYESEITGYDGYPLMPPGVGAETDIYGV